MIEKVKEIVESTSECLKQVNNDIKKNEAIRQSRIAEQREAEELQRQQLYYMNPFPLCLDTGQYRNLESDFYCSGSTTVPLYPYQSAAITEHYIQQAIQNNDVSTLKAIQQATITDLDSRFDFVRLLHYQLYETFIHSYYPNLSYADVTPTGQIFFMNSSGYCLVYSLVVDRKITFDKIAENFKKFKNTQLCKQLFRQYGIKKSKLCCSNDFCKLIVVLR